MIGVKVRDMIKNSTRGLEVPDHQGEVGDGMRDAMCMTTVSQQSVQKGRECVPQGEQDDETVREYRPA